MASPSSAATDANKEAQPTAISATPKKRSAFSIIRAALFSSSDDDSSEKKKAKAVDDKPSIWANLICGIRPLHHPQLDDENEEVVLPPARQMPLPLKLRSIHDLHPLPPPSPGYMSVDEGMSSRYASTEDLQALDTCNEEARDDAEQGCEDKGDDAIDTKAEEFIANFYEQMRLQRVDSVDLS